MKKTLTIVSLVATLAAPSAFSQGTVIFSTSASASTRFSTNSAIGGTATAQGGLSNPAGGDYYFALFYSTTGATTVNGSASAVVGTNGTYAFNAGSGGWTFVTYGTNSAAGGKLLPYISSENSDQTVTIPTINASSTAELVAIGWSANIGSTWQSVQTFLSTGDNNLVGWVGESGVASIVLGNAPGSGGSQAAVSMFGTGAGQVGGILLGESVIPTPEPASMAALGFGALALLRRRRKA